MSSTGASWAWVRLTVLLLVLAAGATAASRLSLANLRAWQAGGMGQSH